jgi:hypothetical protein
VPSFLHSTLSIAFSKKVKADVGMAAWIRTQG